MTAIEQAQEWVESGLRYCLTHAGTVDCDEDEPCDFARSGTFELDEQFDCKLAEGNCCETAPTR